MTEYPFDWVYLLKSECDRCQCGSYTFLENGDGNGLFVLYSRKLAAKARSQAQKGKKNPVLIHKLETSIYQ